ncbi:hypothetical protein SDC9_138709 [bioreactor metagenome]|uniref:Uncharacterized protein n=1 Tax=bioreactor metagenome TaxID=1076179 RepID=A0A645DR17_9ZZZZ
MLFIHIFWHSHYIKRKLRFSTHCIYIRHCICSRYLSEYIRVISYWRKEIYRLNNCQFIIDFIYGCIIAFIKTNYKVFILPHLYALKQLCKNSCSDFRTAAGTFRKLSELYILHIHSSFDVTIDGISAKHASNTPPPTARALSETL